MELDRCYVGDCRDVLRQFAAAGIRAQTCVTSPPYWGLRDYGITPSVWGGTITGCEHDWGEELSVHKGGNAGTTSGLTNRGAHQERNAVKDYQAGRFCTLCGAWLGCLGLEPDYRMFIAHMVEVFACVWDVLADDGTLWLNLGDSYASSPPGNKTLGVSASSGLHGVDSRRYRETLARSVATKHNTICAGLKPKDLCLIPARVAIALQEAGWYVRSDIIWHKPNPMPESITDRPTKAHEYLFLLAKSERYYYDADAIKEPASPDTHARYRRGRSDAHKWADGGPYEHGQTIAKGFEHMAVPSELERRQHAIPVAGWDKAPGGHSTLRHNRGDKSARKLAAAGSGTKNNESFDAAMAVMPEDRNKRSVWTIATEAFPEAHFATFPSALIEPCVLAGSRKGDVVLDPFMGSGTTAQVAEALGRHWIGAEMQEEYLALQRGRLAQRALPL